MWVYYKKPQSESLILFPYTSISITEGQRPCAFKCRVYDPILPSAGVVTFMDLETLCYRSTSSLYEGRKGQAANVFNS